MTYNYNATQFEHEIKFQPLKLIQAHEQRAHRIRKESIYVFIAHDISASCVQELGRWPAV